jgi:hypothetical protein
MNDEILTDDSRLVELILHQTWYLLSLTILDLHSATCLVYIM